MRWKGRRASANVEDRRSARRPAMAGGGIVGIILVLIVIWMGGDPTPLLQQMEQTGAPAGNIPIDPREQEHAQFIAVVLADTEEVWQQLFQNAGQPYRDPTLVLYRDAVSSACGYNSAATGPFYCPGDAKVYIDLSFFDELATRFGADGDFAQAYVIAHEIGHHVQNLTGTSDKVHAARGRVSQEEYNQLSVRLELQADFLAGVWAHHAQQNWNILEPGDIDEALRAATAIGDDRLQRQAQGYTVPESFTHGTSEQRARWFTKGLKTGDPNAGNTFNLAYNQL